MATAHCWSSPYSSPRLARAAWLVSALNEIGAGAKLPRAKVNAARPESARMRSRKPPSPGGGTMQWAENVSPPNLSSRNPSVCDIGYACDFQMYPSKMRVSSRVAAPATEGAHVIVEDEKFFEEDDPFALSAKLTKEVTQSAPPG